MEPEELIKLTKKGESEYAPVPPSGRPSDRKFKLEDVEKKFKDFYIINPFISLVGSTAIHEEGNDIDLVVEGDNLPPEIKEAIDFRLYRQMADAFNIPYDDTPLYLQIHYKHGKPYTSYIPLYALKLERIEPVNKIEMQNQKTTGLELRGNFKIVRKAKKNRRIIAGYASVAIIDDENQYIPLETLKDGLHTLLDDPAYSNLMLIHKNIQIGKIIKEYGDLKTHVDDKGLFIVAEIRDDLKAADAAWREILEGNMNGFSIAGEIISSHDVCDDSSCVEVIDKINIFEVSLCHNPINKESGFVIISKAHVSDNVCNMCERLEDNMVQKKKLSEEEVEAKGVETLEASSEEELKEEAKAEEDEEEEEEEEEEKSETGKDINVTIEELQRKVNALEKIISEKSEYTDFIKECMKDGKSMEECAKEWKESKKSVEKGGLVDLIKEKIETIMKKETITKDDLQELKSMIDKLRGKYPYPYPYPTKYPYPSKYPYPKKADEEPCWFEVVVNAIDDIYEMVTSKDESISAEESQSDESLDEIKLAIKARDDAIKGYEEKIAELESRLKKLESIEEEQKTTTESDDSEIIRDSGVIINRGVIYKAED